MQCLQAPFLHTEGLCPCPWLSHPTLVTLAGFFEPFLLKPLTEPLPYSSVGSIVAELKATPVIRVALISAAYRVGQLHLFSGPHPEQGPSSW